MGFDNFEQINQMEGQYRVVSHQQEVVEGVHLYIYTILPCPMDYTRVTLIVSACQLGWRWEEMANLRGNLRGIIQNEVSLGGSPTINVTLRTKKPYLDLFFNLSNVTKSIIQPGMRGLSHR